MAYALISSSAIGLAVIVGLFSLYPDYFSILATLPLFATPPTVLDSVRNITYIGTSKGNVEQFQNIFYAADTSGSNRFAPPKPITPPPGTVVDATKEGAWCPQGLGDILPFSSRITNISENCLSLRVARPAGTKNDANLPVMVWLFSGGNALGSAYEQMYAPDGLIQRSVASKQPIIYVALNYRLGIFGFAANEALMASGGMNVGLKDQRLALEWVRDHIAEFGGNPTNITAFGHSVGAINIGLHLTSYAGERGVPFQKAIMMSGGTSTNFNIKSDLTANNTARIAEQLSCNTDGDTQSATTINCLRKLSMETLNDAAVGFARSARPPFGEMVFSPTFDNDFIRDRPSALLRAGRFVPDVPLMLSWTTNDGAWYATPTTTNDEDILAIFGRFDLQLSPETTRQLLDLYPPADFEHMVRPEYDGPISPQYYRAAQIMRDLLFTCPVLDFGENYMQYGAQSSGVWLYEMNATRWTSYYEMMGVPMWRVPHLSDIPYVFNTHGATGMDDSAGQRDLAKRMSSSVVRLANTGSPEGSETGFVSWPKAFSGHAGSKEFPNEISILIAGGSHGSGPRTIRSNPTDVVPAGEKALLDARLFERCGFINSESVQSQIKS